MVKPCQQFGAVPAGRVPVQVVPRQTRAVAQQVDRGHLVRRRGIVEPELGQHRVDGIVPGEGAVVHLHREQGGGERLRVRADGKQRVGSHGQLVLDVAPAVAPGEHGLAVLEDRHAQARHLPLPHDRLDPRVEAVEPLVRRLRPDGDGDQAEDEGEGGQGEAPVAGSALLQRPVPGRGSHRGVSFVCWLSRPAFIPRSPPEPCGSCRRGCPECRGPCSPAGSGPR